MDVIEFRGEIKQGGGSFGLNLTIPGRLSLANAPPDWPDELYRGSLNVQVDPSGFPAEFDRLGHGDGVAKLDNGLFRPVLEIPKDQLGKNIVASREGRWGPRAGVAQIWRAELSVCDRNENYRCWLFIRVGSEQSHKLEFVAERQLRLLDGIETGQDVVSRIFGEWVD